MASTSDDATTPGEKTLVRKSRSKYNWEEAENLYVFGEVGTNGSIWYPNHKELSEALDIPLVNVRNRSSTHSWNVKRGEQQLKQAKALAADRLKRMRIESEQFDDTSLNVAKLGMAMVVTRLSEIASAASDSKTRIAEAKERLARGLPVDKSELRSSIWSRELVELATAGATFQSIGMKSLGTDVQRHELTGTIDGHIETTVNVTKEMQRDDEQRVTDILRSLISMGMLPKELEHITDAEVVDEDDEEGS